MVKIEKKPVDMTAMIGRRLLIGFVLNDYADPASAFEADILSVNNGMAEMNVTRDEGDIQHIYRAVGVIMVYGDLGEARSKDPISLPALRRLENYYPPVQTIPMSGGSDGIPEAEEEDLRTKLGETISVLSDLCNDVTKNSEYIESLEADLKILMKIAIKKGWIA